jgi:hypothetical protein
MKPEDLSLPKKYTDVRQSAEISKPGQSVITVLAFGFRAAPPNADSYVSSTFGISDVQSGRQDLNCYFAT